jgi:hypothetical protein
MGDVSKAEAALIKAKAVCFKVCGNLAPDVASDRGLAEAAHEKHRAELEDAYAAFQHASGPVSASNPAAPGTTQVKANLVVDTGLN